MKTISPVISKQTQEGIEALKTRVEIELNHLRDILSTPEQVLASVWNTASLRFDELRRLQETLDESR